jgi:spermidine/putrescine transport system substrate-binding protein
MRILRMMAATLALALVAAACGSDEPAAGPDGCEPGGTDGDLLFYNWSDYMDPDLLDAFAEEYGVSVVEDFYPSNEDMFARVTAGGAQYDVIVPSDYMVEIMIEEELLLPLDHALIPNIGNVDDQFATPPYDPGLDYSVPYQWGTTGLGVNVGLLGDVEPSWALVFDPEVAGALPGRVSLLDDPRETIGAALYYLGYDPNTTSEDELAEAADVITASRDWIAAFDSDLFSDLLLAGEVVVAHGYSGNFLDSFGDDEDYAYLIPEEGATIWTDNLAILADAPHPCTAHTFIDFILDAENGAALTNWTYYASPNAAAAVYIEPEILEDDAIYPPDEVLDDLYFLEDTGDFEINFSDYFIRAKS